MAVRKKMTAAFFKAALNVCTNWLLASLGASKPIPRMGPNWLLAMLAGC
jgi:hypothetical protein